VLKLGGVAVASGDRGAKIVCAESAASIATALTGWPQPIDTTALAGGARRLGDALNALAASEPVASGDIIALVRQLMLSDDPVSGTPDGVALPRDPRWPSGAAWSTAGCRVTPSADGERVIADPWWPPTTGIESSAAASDVVAAVYRGTRPPSHEPSTVPADPFWQEDLGYSNYRSVAQRQAARVVATAPPGATITAVLPTSAGKTSVVLARALRSSRYGGVSVVVVPTVVLALDLERRTREVLEAQHGRPSPTGRYAYTGDLAADVKQQLRQDVWEGQQRILFTSPEALLTGLADAVLDAAAAGLLRMLVLDEAHLVEQWGNEFRPEFQGIAALRTSMINAAPPSSVPVTVLMTATLTQGILDTLTCLFGEPGPMQVVWASALRPEPSFHAHHVADEAAKEQALHAAVARLPRPMIVYATRIEDVRRWLAAFHSWGYERVAAVTGESTAQERRDVLEGWRGQTLSGQSIPSRYDVVIATSAFGLGVDLADVRTIIHVCVPETIDRFYQEVGRAGRDGWPALSYLIWTDEDRQRARMMSVQNIITAETGWGRWQAMLVKAAHAEDGCLEVDLATLPANVPEESRQSRQWNARTLNLMVRAGLVRLRVPRPPERAPGEGQDEWTARRHQFYQSRVDRLVVELLDGGATVADVWKKRVDQVRDRVLAGQRRAYAAMLAVLSGDRCIGAILADHYQVDHDEGVLPTQPVCRSCPACRCRLDVVSGAHGVPESVQARPLLPAWSLSPPDPLRALRGDQPLLRLTWSRITEREDLVPELVALLARRGLSVVGGNGLSARELTRVQREARDAVVIHDQDGHLLRTYPDPMLVVLDHGPFAYQEALVRRCRGSWTTYIITAEPAVATAHPALPWNDLSLRSLPVRVALKEL
jgi:ATP-dependent DNA helicase RecQ